MSEEHDPVLTQSVLKSELTVLKSELQSAMTLVKSELQSEMTLVKSELQSEMTLVKSELKSGMTDLEQRLEKRISEEGSLTRAHFNIMVEKVNDSVRLVAEVSGHHSSVLDDHETRLQRIEKRA